MKRLILSLIVITCFTQCNKQKSEVCASTTSLYSKSDFPMGVAIHDLALQQDSMYENIFVSHFNSATAENIFKPSYLHPEENIYDWIDADNLITFCKANHKRIHGHTLIWHMQNPNWMNNFSGSTSEWNEMMRMHITSIVRHFGNQVYSWDVVNEAFNEDGSLRNNIWLEHIGPSYIEKAYRYANEANPQAILFYNDYNLETNPIKRKAVIQFFNALKSRGVCLDGIGMQMHLNTLNSPIEIIEAAIRDVANEHYLLHLSEVDISTNSNNNNPLLQHKDLQMQADLMYKIVRAYKNIPVQQQFGITFWGISDQYSWIRNYYNRMDYPLLFNEEYQPKPIFCKLLETL